MNTFFYKLLHWETWHYHLKYLPLYPAWLWYCLRARSLWFFTPSNPTLTFGGFEGESKLEMYQQLPPGSYPPTILARCSASIDSIVADLSLSNISFPVAVKPDVGMMGFLFRRIDTVEDLEAYHEKMPADYLVQQLINYPIEVSVFYYRFPDKSTGKITGFVRKDYPEVQGDGISTLQQLITTHPQARFRQEELFAKHRNKLDKILAKDEKYYLSLALNLSRGGRLVSLEREKDEQLLAVFDRISQYTGKLYYGRYDIKCRSIDDLKQGKNFSILEYNGCGAEPHHIYGNGNNLLQAYQILLHHWKALYQISRQNYRNGYRYWSFKEGLVFLAKAKKHFKELKSLDKEMPLFI